MWQRFTEEARKAVFYAQEEAQRYGSNNVDSEHLLLGSLREPGPQLRGLLASLGTQAEEIGAIVRRTLAPSDNEARRDISLTPNAKGVIDMAYASARDLKSGYIGAEHIFLGVLRRGQSPVVEVLADRNITYRRAINALPGDKAASPASRPRGIGTFLRPFVERFSADLLALVLLKAPSPALAERLRRVAEISNRDDELFHPNVLSFVLEQSIAFAEPTVTVPTAAEFVDSANGQVAIFGKIAMHSGTLTHAMLVGAGATEEALQEGLGV